VVKFAEGLSLYLAVGVVAVILLGDRVPGAMLLLASFVVVVFVLPLLMLVGAALVFLARRVRG
jgi:cation transporter-like permease